MPNELAKTRVSLGGTYSLRTMILHNTLHVIEAEHITNKIPNERDVVFAFALGNRLRFADTELITYNSEKCVRSSRNWAQDKPICIPRDKIKIREPNLEIGRRVYYLTWMARRLATSFTLQGII